MPRYISFNILHPNIAMVACRFLFAIPSKTQMQQPTRKRTARLEESGWSGGSEDLLAGGLGDTVWQRELEVLGEELLDVWAADVVGLGDLNDLEDLDECEYSTPTRRAIKLT